MSPLVPTSRLLRLSTSAPHARVDALVRAVLARGDEGRVFFLRASADVVVAWETELRRFSWPDRALIDQRLRKSAWLAHDLGGSYPPASPHAHATTQFEAWGALYVMEGSTLGAAMIVRMLPGGVMRYLQGYGRETRVMWTNMQAALDAEVRGRDAQRECVGGALKVFSQFEEALERHA